MRWMNGVVFALVVGLCLGLGTVGYAQEESEETPPRIEALQDALKGRSTKPDPTLAVAPEMVAPGILDSEGNASMQAAFKAYYDYRVHGFEHRKGVFAWQLLSAKIIFVLVVALVLLGVYFSWMQFHAALRGNGKDGETDTTVELGASGLKVSSPVLGVIILTLSLAFFYLYLVNVYPIEEIF